MAGRRLFPLLLMFAAACGQPMPTAVSHFDSQGLSFDYPATWNAASYFMPSSFKNRIVYLSREPLSDPCDRTSDSTMTSISCPRSPVASLSPGGVLVDWSADGWPGWMFDSKAGAPIRAGAMRGTIEVAPAGPSCTGMGGETDLTVIVPTGPGNWIQVSGCVDGAYEGTIKAQVEAMLASVEWH